jgi:nitrite reductase/ring-hydroxylating ferredoxin subunit
MSQRELAVIASFVEVAELSRIAPGAGTMVTVAANSVAIFNVDGRLFAVDDACLRCGGSLASGTLLGHLVTCSRCDWRYDVTTGAVQGVPLLRTSCFDVKIADSHVLVSTTAMFWSRAASATRGT